MKSQKNNKWNLSLLFSSDNDPKLKLDRVEIEKQNYKFINKWKDRNDYLEKSNVLKEALDEFETLEDNYGLDGKEGFYFWLRTAQEQNNEELKAKFNKLIEFAQKIENDIQFFTLRLAKVSKEKQKEFLTTHDLKDYKHFLKTLFDESKYLLSEAEEKILNLTGKVAFYNWSQMTSNFLAKEEVNFGKGKKNYSELIALLDNKNKKTRETAAKGFNSIISKWIDVGVVEINSVLESKKIVDELRKTKRPDEIRHLTDDVDSEIVDTMLNSVEKEFDQAKKFYELKSKLFKVKKLKYYERNLTYGNLDKKYSYEDSKSIIHRVLKNLDSDFDIIFTNFIDEGRIDVFPAKGKTSGAFMANGLKSQPIYILLNYTDKLQDVLTLAHEMGHAIHYTLSKIQNSLNCDPTTLTAEVASTFMEDFVLQEILKTADDELKLALIMIKLNDEISTIHRQVACYRFEQQIHKEFREKGYLSKEELGKMFQNNMKAYLGDFVEQSENSENWWLGWSHIRSFFYVYTYASGLLISKSLQNLVKKDVNNINKVKKFLESGSVKSPKEIFAELDIDLSDKNFWKAGLDEISENLKFAETLAKKLNKI